MTDTLDPTVTEALRSWRVMLEAGIASSEALTSAARMLRGVARACFLQASDRTAKGDNITLVLDAMTPVLTQGERAILAAGWSAGRIESTIDALVKQRELWSNARRRIVGKMVKPCLTLLAASFIAPITILVVDANPVLYLICAIVPILIAAATIGAAVWFFRYRATAHVVRADGSIIPPTAADTFLLRLPVASFMERQRSIAEFSELLAHLLNAGLPIVQALDATARSARNGCYRAESMRLSQATSTGESFSAALQEDPGELWPHEYRAACAIGERAGRLDSSLSELAKRARDNYTRAVEHFADWLPRIFYGFIALFVIINIFRFVLMYSQMLENAMNPNAP